MATRWSGHHPTTFEVTREVHLTKNGNCIIGVSSDKGCNSLSAEFKGVLAHDDAVLITTLSCGGKTTRIKSHGSSLFTLDHPTDIVSEAESLCLRATIGILSDHVAATLPADLISEFF